MNYKLEKFWNVATWVAIAPNVVWTINLKSFEISQQRASPQRDFLWTINLKSFEMAGR